jgi:hypothetical protein
MLRLDFMILLNQFYSNATLLRGVLSYFVTLIPKIPSPQSIGDFRPISLLGCVYKVIDKVLTARLRVVMGDVIS